MMVNFGKYFKFICRRERIASLIWIVAITASVIVFASLYPGMLPDQEALLGYQAMLDVPTMAAIMGPGYGKEALTPAIVMSHECSIWFAITVIAMNIFFVNRHTRKDEELGRFEMLSALPVGRLSGSMAAITSAFLLNAFISAASALGLIALNIEGTTAAGAFAYTLSFGAQGFLFAAVTLLAAQLFSTARASSGAAFAVMGVSFMLRAYGDIRNNILSYISPMGLGLKVEAFYTDNFVPVIVLFAEAVAISAVALAINLKRDVGSGVFPARKGREHASYFLKSPFGFALRLLRNSILSWSMVFIAVGAMFGSVISQLDSFLESNELMRQLLTIQSGAVSTAEAFLPMLCGMTAMIISIPVITAISRLYGEEKRGRMEQIYARAVPRTALFLSFAAIALAQAVLFTLCSVFGIYAAAQGTGLLQLSTLMKASFVYLPAILAAAGVTVLLIGAFPKFTALAWALPVYSFIILYFGKLFDIPQWVTKISPFEATPQLPVQSFALPPLVILSAIALLLCAAGFYRYRNRDIG